MLWEIYKMVYITELSQMVNIKAKLHLKIDVW